MQDDSRVIGPQGAPSQRAAPVAKGNRSDNTGNADTFLVAPPTVSLPKGGGAMRGIGEKFSANPVTGTGSMSVPIALSPGRGGFGPQLALSYDSGAGQGPYGLGWSLGLPGISRKTDKGLPRYLDDDESDVFLLSGAEDLVPVLKAGQRVVEHVQFERETYAIHLYRPRVEGLFARIERWAVAGKPETTFWRTISRENITTWYGRGEESRIFEPRDKEEDEEKGRIYQWLICQTNDDKGNVAVYRYIQEDGRNVDLGDVWEANRQAEVRQANRYLKRILYGNVKPYLPKLGPVDPDPLPTAWMFEAVFDYGDHSARVEDGRFPSPQPDVTWPARTDAFSSHRAGFEVRTYRLCHRVLMFHHFPAAPGVGQNCLVRSTEFGYAFPDQANDGTRSGYTVLRSVTQRSYQKKTPDTTTDYAWRDLPPVNFTYSQPVVNQTIQVIDPAQLDNLPVGLQGPGYRWIDLDGEGLSGVLAEQAGGWYYKPNLGDGTFGPMRAVAPLPAMALAAGSRHQFMDLAGDGEIDVVDFSGPTPGFHERDRDDGWKRHVPFASLPNIDWQDPNLRFVDLTGNGHADALITEQEVFTWYPSLDEHGFAAAERTRQSIDEDAGPSLVFDDGTQTVFLADMCGDGLTDLVRIRNGEVCYWPNLGYGRFGRKVTLGNSPRFDHSDLFDPSRIRLTDIDGSGPIDIIYLGRDGARLYFNRSGNSLSDPLVVNLPVGTENLGAVQVADLLGNGTACLVWNSHLPADAGRPVYYVDLMGGSRETPQEHRQHEKPHLLIKVDNNLGATTELHYTPSTRFYLQDQQAGTPWVTRLPFPVHCVSKVTVRDKWRGTAFSSTYSYHHGYFDGVEREFRGFGRVEQVDIEAYDVSAAANVASPFVTGDKTLYQPPVKSITWFHTGIATDRSRILAMYEREYFPSRYADRLAGSGFTERALPQPEIEAAAPELEADEWREAMRACKGMVLRQEVVELDADALHERGEHTAVRLFSAAQHNCHIRRVQPRGPNRHAVFLVTESEAVTYHYELALGGVQALEPDPRIAHTLNLRFDDHGRVLQSVAAVYGRVGSYAIAATDTAPLTAEQVKLIHAVQLESHLAYTETRFTEPLPSDLHNHRLPMPCEIRTYELTGIGVPTDSHYFSIDQLRDYQLDPALDTQASKPVYILDYHEQAPDQRPYKRLVEHAATLYFKDDLSGPLGLGQPSRLGLTYEAYKLALTAPLLDAVFSGKPTQDRFADEARAALALPGARNDFFASGYALGSGIFGAGATPSWWLRSGIAGFASDAAMHFYLPKRYVDPFGNQSTIAYDTDHDLFVQSSIDALGNTTTVEVFDYRVLAPARVKDANGNSSEAAFDIRGLPVATAVMGKVLNGTSETGDTVAALSMEALNPTPAAVALFFETAPLDERQARTWLGKATARFVYHFGERYPAGTAGWGATAAGACSIVREQHERDLANAPSGGIPLQIAFEYSDGAGQTFVSKVETEAEPGVANGPVRWIANGKTIVNNKGKPVLQYEPYFSASGHRFEEPAAAGVSPVMVYDAPGRLIRTELPDGTLSRVEFSPWFSRSFDPNDTVLDAGNRWYTEHTAPGSDAHDQRAARLAALHANTPAESHFDSLGREVIAIARNSSPSRRREFDNLALIERPWDQERILTFTKLDAEGKPLWICDARGNRVMQYITPPQPDHTPLYDEPEPRYEPAYDMPRNAAPCYDVAGNLLFQHSMDAGDRRMLMDAAGQPMLAWDYNERTAPTPGPNPQVFKEHRRFEASYDALHRPTERRLRIRDESTGAEQEFLIEHWRYGESRPGDKNNNLRGQLWQHYDGSGLAQTDAFDLSGRPLAVHRRLSADIEAPVIDWTGGVIDDVHAVAAPGFDGEVFTQRTVYDALGRMTCHYNWHVESPPASGQSERVAVYLPQYNRRGALDSEKLLVRARKTVTGREEVAGVTVSQQAIKAISYNAKGQKLTLELGNGTTTRYTYDATTFRLTHLYTRRDAGFNSDCASGTADQPRPVRPCGVQNLHYHYDPAGNITHIQDDAQQTIYFANAAAEPSNDYVYDALYRLIEATGRENGVAMGAPAQPEGPWPSGTFASPNATRNYTQRYRYDRVGNIEEMRHMAPGGSPTSPPGWTRNYCYAQDSNRLLQTWYRRRADPSLGREVVIYAYDTHGSMLNLNAVDNRFDMRRDWNDMIHTVDLGGGGRAWYQYGADKQRCRKRLVRNPQVSNGTLLEDRIYLGGYELYRRYTGDPLELVEEIESHHLFEGEQRVLLVDDVISTDRTHSDGTMYRTQPILRYQYGNHLGSVLLELDEAAQIISYEEFHPYGTSAFRLMQTDTEAPARRYRYTGMERDEESGLNYHSARFYAPSVCRWTAADPSGVTSGANLYQYAKSSPTIMIDRTGMADIEFQSKGKGYLRQGFSINVDESRAVGEPGISKAERMSRAKDMASRNFREATDNSVHKWNYTEVPSSARVVKPSELPVVSLKENPGAIWRPELGNVEEWKKFSKEVMSKVAPNLKGKDAGAVKVAINKEIIASLRASKRSPSAELIARTIEKETGMSINDVFKTDFKMRVKWGQRISSLVKVVGQVGFVVSVLSELYAPYAAAGEIDQGLDRLDEGAGIPLGRLKEIQRRLAEGNSQTDLVEVRFGTDQHLLFDPQKEGPATLFRIVGNPSEAADLHVQMGDKVKVMDLYWTGDKWESSDNDGTSWISNSYPGGIYALNRERY